MIVLFVSFSTIYYMGGMEALGAYLPVSALVCIIFWEGGRISFCTDLLSCVPFLSVCLS